MSNTYKPSCYLIGGDTLLMECGRQLMDGGFELTGVISRTPRIEEWAVENGLAFLSLDGDYLGTLDSNPVDYLFSITHLEVLPKRALACAKRHCINFHDGPLPRYAGLNAPAWALINGETEYGITWHTIVPGIDEGDILLQETIPIAPDETSLSLNTRCFATALETFPRLLERLKSDDLHPIAQDLGQRTYFARNQKPANAGVLDWSRTAGSLSALVRALDFGSYPNPLASAKLLTENGAWIVRAVVERDGGGVPGTILALDEGEIEVATGNGSLVITAMATLEGKTQAIPDVVAQSNLASRRSTSRTG